MIGDYGLAKGLAYRYDSHDDLEEQRFHALRMAIIKGQKDAETKQLAQDLKFPTAVNKWDSQQIANWSKDFVTNGIGGFLRENPDYATDPVKSAQLQHLKDLLHNNPLVAKASRNDYARAKHLEWKSKTPNAANFPEDAIMDQQWQNYERTGSIDGNPENKIDFTFVDPDKLFNTDKEAERIGENMIQDDIRQENYGHITRITSRPSEKTVENSALAALSNNETGHQWMRDYYRLPKEVQESKSPLQFVKERLQAKGRITMQNLQNPKYLYDTGGSGKSEKQGVDPYAAGVLGPYQNIVNNVTYQKMPDGSVIPIHRTSPQIQLPVNIGDGMVLDDHNQFQVGADSKFITKSQTGNLEVTDLPDFLKNDKIRNGKSTNTLSVDNQLVNGRWVQKPYVHTTFKMPWNELPEKEKDKYFKNDEGDWQDDLNPRYKQVMSVDKEVDSKGKETKYVYFTVAKPIDIHNPITHAKANKYANMSARSTEDATEDVTYIDENGKQVTETMNQSQVQQFLKQHGLQR